MLSPEQGAKLVNLARDSIVAYLSGKRPKVSSSIKQEFSEPLGVFVTLNKGEHLRGCIGFPQPVMTLHEAVVNAARSACSSDPRFPTVTKEEMDDITVEVSVLTLPKMIEVRNPEDYTAKIKIGRDGLIVKGTYESGLLLPQVAVEYGWDVPTFLDQTCVKANLPPRSWMDFNQVRVYGFQSQVFSEESPNGNIIVKM